MAKSCSDFYPHRNMQWGAWCKMYSQKDARVCISNSGNQQLTSPFHFQTTKTKQRNNNWAKLLLNMWKIVSKRKSWFWDLNVCLNLFSQLWSFLRGWILQRIFKNLKENLWKLNIPGKMPIEPFKTGTLWEENIPWLKSLQRSIQACKRN